MESLDYYISVPANPYAEDERDQEDIILSGDYQFRMDSIVETIGKSECKHNIDLFLIELYDEMEYETLANFYNRCLTNLIEVYELHVLDEYISKRYYENNMQDELTKMLMFFEHDGWVEFLSEILPIDNPSMILKQDLKQHLELNYNKIIENIKNKREQISKYIFKQLMMAAKDDTVKLILKLISKNRNALATQIILNRGI